MNSADKERYIQEIMDTTSNKKESIHQNRYSLERIINDLLEQNRKEVEELVSQKYWEDRRRKEQEELRKHPYF